MIKNIEAIFTRNNLTAQELKILHGIISNLVRTELEDGSWQYVLQMYIPLD